jgi:hypothetical protein
VTDHEPDVRIVTARRIITMTAEQHQAFAARGAGSSRRRK